MDNNKSSEGKMLIEIFEKYNSAYQICESSLLP